MVEKAIFCNESTEEIMDDLMEDIRDRRRRVHDRQGGHGSSSVDQMEEEVSSCLGAIDRLIEPGVKIWDKMKKVSVKWNTNTKE